MNKQDFLETFKVVDQAEMTNRLLPDNDDRTEWSEYGILTTTGQKVVLYYMTTPESEEEVDGDWGVIDWEDMMDRVEELDENGLRTGNILYQF